MAIQLAGVAVGYCSQLCVQNTPTSTTYWANAVTEVRRPSEEPQLPTATPLVCHRFLSRFKVTGFFSLDLFPFRSSTNKFIFPIEV